MRALHWQDEAVKVEVAEEYDEEGLIPLEELTRVEKPRLSQTLPIKKTRGAKFWERDEKAPPKVPCT